MSSVNGSGTPSCVLCGGHEVVYVTSDHELLLCRHCVTRLEVLRARSDWSEARHARVMRRGPRLTYRWSQQVAQVIEERWGEDEGEKG